MVEALEMDYFIQIMKELRSVASQEMYARDFALWQSLVGIKPVAKYFRMTPQDFAVA
jgi:hypothetical protein